MSETPSNNPGSLERLKLDADALGIRYHPNIGYEKLEEKVNKEIIKRAREDNLAMVLDQDRLTKAAAKVPAIHKSPEQLRKDNLRLRRIRINCMNPAKKEWDGEVFTIRNKSIGVVKKFVPYTDADDGWHVPQAIYDFLKEAKCQIFIEAKDSKGNKIRKGKIINEYAIEDLPPLTPREIKELARQQAMANRIG